MSDKQPCPACGAEKYHSQYGECLIVDKIFGPHRGRLLEIGAYDPKDKSNSRLFIERGWEAILVEFSPAHVRTLVQEYAGNPSVKVIMGAASAGENGKLVEFSLNDDATSTNDADSIEKWKEATPFYGKAWIPQVAISQITLQFGGGFDCISVDTEGSSVDLAIHIVRDLEQHPRVLVVEHDSRQVELMKGVQQWYSAYWENGTNIILVKK